jgi:Sulfotransferase domain
LLRNPIDRAYSHYRHEVTKVRRNNRLIIEPLAFEDALELEELRLRGESEKMLQDDRYSSFNHQHFSYLSRGVYADQLARWFEFFSKEQMLVLKSEDFFERTPEVFKRTLSFLGLPDWTPEEWEIFLKGNYEREMAPATRRQLEVYFEPHNRRLYDYLGVDFDW